MRRAIWRSGPRRRWRVRSITRRSAFATVNNIGSGHKYPYDPFYGGFSPRFSIAWNPKFNDGILGKLLGSNATVLRAGYGRLFGRLNGVNQLLVPLLPPGLLQAVSCTGVSRSGGGCLGSNGVDASSAFRIGTDGLSAPLPNVSQTLSQPFIPGPCWQRRRRGRHGPRSQVSSGTHRQPDGQHPAPDQQDSEHGSRLHRPHYPQRNAADQSGFGAVHDHARRAELRGRVLEDLLPRGCRWSSYAAALL